MTDAPSRPRLSPELQARINAIAAKAPPLTPEQIRHLRAVFSSVRARQAA